MELSGQRRFPVDIDTLWNTFHDPSVLARTLPGCEELTVVTDEQWDALVSVGVGTIRGTYQGTVTLSEQQPPNAWRMRVRGAGAPGTVDADVAIRLQSIDPTETALHWEATAIVGGVIGGVGQRMLAAVARRTADQFFAAVEHDLTKVALPSEDAGSDVAFSDHAASPAQSGPTATGSRLGETLRAARSTPRGDGSERSIIAATVTGGALALLGVLVGRRFSGGRRGGRV